MVQKEPQHTYSETFKAYNEAINKTYQSMCNNTVNTVSKADLFVTGCKSVGICTP